MFELSISIERDGDQLFRFSTDSGMRELFRFASGWKVVLADDLTLDEAKVVISELAKVIGDLKDDLEQKRWDAMAAAMGDDF